MKTRLILAILLTFIASFFPATSQAADDRVFYYGKEDEITPEVLSEYFDVRSLQVALTSSGYVQFYVLMHTEVDEDKLVDQTYVAVLIDTDGKSGSEYGFNTAGITYYGSSKSELKVYDNKNGESREISGCDGSSWITEDKDAIAFEVLASCIKNVTSASAIAIASDGTNTDFSPETISELKFKTNYMSTKPCTIKTKDTKIIFKSTQYICIQKNGKWNWVDYGPIAAAKAKYLTEKAFYKCGLHVNNVGAVLSDKGKTLELDGVYKYLVTENQFACVTSTLGMPSSVKSKLSMTRALDGIQSAKFGKISVDWNFHPSDGLSITFTYN